MIIGTSQSFHKDEIRHPKLEEQWVLRREIIKMVVDNCRNRCLDTVEYLQDHKEATQQILSLKDRNLKVVLDKYRLTVEEKGSISGIFADEPFDWKAKIESEFGGTAIVENAKDKAANTVKLMVLSVVFVIVE